MTLTELYFAYGAHMDAPTLREQAGDVEVVSPARLVGLRVVFSGHDPIWDGGTETLVADASAETWGILYSLRAAEWERLDTRMGATLEGAGAHFHYPVEAQTPAGQSLQARTFRKSVQGELTLPSREYVDFLVAAATVSGLPDGYGKRLSALSAMPARYPVPRQNPMKRRHLHLL
jgi:hypothetical protein